MADITTKMAEALRLAHDHIEMDKLLVSHPRDWALIKDALAYEAEAKPAPAPLTNADVVEAWRTTEARRDDYGWTSCEWFQEGVRFAQRHYRVGAAAPAALAALEAEAKPAPAEPVGWALVPVEPTPQMLACIVRKRYPEDWEAGKRLQMRQRGENRVPFKQEYEMAAGQYERMLAAAPAAPAPVPLSLPEALPPLPAPVTYTDLYGFLHTEQQMHDYALVAIEASKGGAA